MTLQERPYQLFFPLALAGAFVLSIPWIPVLPLIQRTWPVFPAFPREFHIQAAIELFLLPALSGFLLTALPKMHSAALPPRWLVLLLFSIEFAGFFSVLTATGWTFAAASTILLGVSFYYRIKGSNPVYTIPLAVGLAAGAAGSIFVLYGETTIGRSLVTYGMMPLLIGGAGAMLAVPLSDYPAKPEWKMAVERTPKAAVWLLAAAFALSALPLPYLNWVQAAIAILCGFRWLHLKDLRYFQTVQSRVFMAAVSFIVLGLILMAAAPSLRVHFAHILFAAGLSAAIAAVMVQVVLSHGGHVMRPLPGGRLLTAAGILLVFAGVTRVSAALIPAMYLSHLSYAAMCYALAWVLWIIAYGRKIPQTTQKPP